MEYKKETEKFSFGIGTEKVAGKGNLAETKGEDAKLAKIAIAFAVTAGAQLLKLAYRKHKNKK